MVKEIKTINVIGIDRKKHIAESHSNLTLCGIKILHKKVKESDNNLPSCYACTY